MKKKTKTEKLYEEDILQSVRELTPIQAEMLSFALSGETSESIDLKKFYLISPADIPDLKDLDPVEAFAIMDKEATSLFDLFVMVRGGIEAETDEDIEFYRWLSQLHYFENDNAFGFLFSELVPLYFNEIQKALASRQEPTSSRQGKLNLF